MEMTLSLTENDINDAVRKSLQEKIPFIPEDITVNYTAGRGGKGLTGDVSFTIGDAPIEPTEPTTSKGSVSLKTPKPQAEPTVAEETTEEVAPDAKNEKTAVEEAPTQEEEAEKPAKASKSLFGAD